MPNQERELPLTEKILSQVDMSTLDSALESLKKALDEVFKNTDIGKREIFDKIIDKHFGNFKVKLDKDKIFNDIENDSLKLWHESEYILENQAE